MDSNSEPKQQRQHINISNHAYEILLNDISAFNVTGQISGLVNKIIWNSWESSEATITNAREHKKNELIEKVRNGKSNSRKKGDSTTVTPKEKEVIKYLLNAYEAELVDKFITNPRPKDKAIKIRLQNAVYEQLAPSKIPCLASHYNGYNGLYIKDLVEDYADQSFFKREEIYFKEMLDLVSPVLRNPLDKRELYRIRVRIGDSYADFRAKPYLMSTESDSPYHYLVALTKPIRNDVQEDADNNDSSYRPSAIRLSRIMYFKETKGAGSGKITHKEQTAVRNAIDERGIPYILDDILEFKVRLTPRGLGMYNNILHLRPIASKSEHDDSTGCTTLTFQSTRRQIENYFMTFCGNAKIISPNELAEDFKAAYKDAYDVYCAP